MITPINSPTFTTPINLPKITQFHRNPQNSTNQNKSTKNFQIPPTHIKTPKNYPAHHSTWRSGPAVDMARRVWGPMASTISLNLEVSMSAISLVFVISMEFFSREKCNSDDRASSSLFFSPFCGRVQWFLMIVGPKFPYFFSMKDKLSRQIEFVYWLK